MKTNLKLLLFLLASITSHASNITTIDYSIVVDSSFSSKSKDFKISFDRNYKASKDNLLCSKIGVNPIGSFFLGDDFLESRAKRKFKRTKLSLESQKGALNVGKFGKCKYEFNNILLVSARKKDIPKKYEESPLFCINLNSRIGDGYSSPNKISIKNVSRIVVEGLEQEKNHSSISGTTAYTSGLVKAYNEKDEQVFSSRISQMPQGISNACAFNVQLGSDVKKYKLPTIEFID